MPPQPVCRSVGPVAGPCDGYVWEEGPNSFQPNDFVLKAALDAIKALAPKDDILASWHPSRSQILVRFRGRKKVFLAPSFNKSCKRGDVRTPLDTAVRQASEWIEGHRDRPLPAAVPVPLAGPSAAAPAPETQETQVAQV